MTHANVILKKQEKTQNYNTRKHKKVIFTDVYNTLKLIRKYWTDIIGETFAKIIVTHKNDLTYRNDLTYLTFDILNTGIIWHIGMA